MAIYITFYCLIVIAHVYYRFSFDNKISRFLREKISQKLFQAKTYDKEKILANYQELKRFNVIFPLRFLQRVDKYRKTHGLKRSTFLLRAAEEYLDRH